VGQTEKQARHELRQVVSVNSSVLQKGNNEKDREISEASIPVLPSVLPLKPGCCGISNRSAFRVIRRLRVSPVW